jgi:hypothetical protein
MGNIAGPRPVVFDLSEDPRDRYVVPCSCGHDYGDHKRYGSRCKGFDSYNCICECPSYEADENIIADFI